MKAAFHIAIKSCNRPTALGNLLSDLRTQAPAGTEVRIYDDGSTEPMGPAKVMAERMGWVWLDLERHGKSRAWQLHNRIYEDLSGIDEDDFIVFFDDDMRLCDRFFQRVLQLWAELREADKVSLHLMVDGSRDKGPCWTGYAPRLVTRRIRRTQWVDGSFVCQRRLLDAIGGALKPIDSARWAGKRDLSTGCGEQLSLRLHDLGLGMYQVHESLLVHVPIASQYHGPEVRKKDPLLCQRFVDGAAAERRLHRLEPTEVSLASIPSRAKILERVVRRLLPGVDVVRVYLNGYDTVPAGLAHEPRVLIARSQDHGDRGDAGKFFWADEARGYQIICDDDLLYPASYAETLVNALERYKREAVVGFHGIVLREAVQSYYADRRVTHFSTKLKVDQPVHLLGTGTIAYHPSSITVHPEDFPIPNMADIWLGRLAQAQAVPMIMLAREGTYLTGIQTTDKPIFDRFHRSDEAQTEAINSQGLWRMYKHRGVEHELGPRPKPTHVRPARRPRKRP